MQPLKKTKVLRGSAISVGKLVTRKKTVPRNKVEEETATTAQKSALGVGGRVIQLKIAGRLILTRHLSGTKTRLVTTSQKQLEEVLRLCLPAFLRILRELVRMPAVLASR